MARRAFEGATSSPCTSPQVFQRFLVLHDFLLFSLFFFSFSFFNDFPFFVPECYQIQLFFQTSAQYFGIFVKCYGSMQILS